MKRILKATFMAALIFAVSTTVFLPASAAAKAAKTAKSPFVDKGAYYTYVLPQKLSKRNYYERAFSSSHEFRDIFIAQFGKEKAFVYDLLAHMMIQALYDDSVAYGKEIKVEGLDKISNNAVSAAGLAVTKDMPFLETFVSLGRMSSEHFKGNPYILMKFVGNYFSDKAPKDSATYIATRNSVIKELKQYRAAVSGVTDDEEKLEIVAEMFDSGSVYDLEAPYHALEALLEKRGICGSSSWAFSMVGNAVGIPTYYLSVTNKNHAVALVKPNGGKLKVIDVTMGQRAPKVESISEWQYGGDVNWGSLVLNFNNDFYYPKVDIIEQLGGLS